MGPKSLLIHDEYESLRPARLKGLLNGTNRSVRPTWRTRGSSNQPTVGSRAGTKDVRISIKAIGVNRLDALVRAGNAPRPVRLPGARLGIEGAGTINAIGGDVRDFKVGDEVFVTSIPDMDTNGAYAEQLVLPAEPILKRPPQLDAVHAAAFWVAYSTAYGGLIEKARMQPGDHVLITAASSSVGLAAIQIANQIGAVPIAITRSSEKRAALMDAGAHRVIATDRENTLEITTEMTGGKGVDLILDMVMGPGLVDLVKSARMGGKLVTVGWLDSRAAPFLCIRSPFFDT